MPLPVLVFLYRYSYSYFYHYGYSCSQLLLLPLLVLLPVRPTMIPIMLLLYIYYYSNPYSYPYTCSYSYFYSHPSTYLYPFSFSFIYVNYESHVRKLENVGGGQNESGTWYSAPVGPLIGLYIDIGHLCKSLLRCTQSIVKTACGLCHCSFKKWILRHLIMHATRDLKVVFGKLTESRRCNL